MVRAGDKGAPDSLQAPGAATDVESIQRPDKDGHAGQDRVVATAETLRLGAPPEQQGQEIIAALDHAPFTPRHAVFIIALLAALVLDYAKPYTISFVIPGMRAMFHISEAAAATLPVAGLTGTMVGATFWGFVADRIGRRTTLLWTISIFSISTLCGLAVEYWQSLLACLAMGFGVGGEAPIVFALATEYLPARPRARILVFLGIAGAVGGYALAALIATAANSHFEDMDAWRAMWLVQLLPAALILVLRSRVVPESSRFLLARGRVDEARQAAESLIGTIAFSDLSAPAPMRDGRPMLGSPASLYWRTITLGFFSFAWGLANYGFVTWLPTVLRGLGYTGAMSSGYLALSALIALPALAITTLLVTRWSTRWTLATYALGGGLALAALGTGAAVGWLTPLSLVVVTGIAFFFLTSIGSVFSPYTAEVFPTRVRARRSGIVAAASRLGGVVGPFFGGLSLTASGSVLGLQLPLAAMLVLAAAVMALAGVETRGRTLEQIDGH